MAIKNFLAIDKLLLPLFIFLVVHTVAVKADAVTDWNKQAGDIVVAAGIGPLPAERALAIVHAAVYEAVNAITQR